jgi:hypothetical protein
VQELTLPLPSFTLSVTALAPTLTQPKLEGLTETKFTVPQLSLLERRTLLVLIEAAPAALKFTVMFLQFTTGNSLSVTVTLKLQLAVAAFAAVTLYTILYTPTVCEEPLATPLVWAVVAPAQLSVPTGAVHDT